MGTFDAGTLNGDPVSLQDNRPRSGRRPRHGQGKKVAISSKRSSYGRTCST